MRHVIHRFCAFVLFVLAISSHAQSQSPFTVDDLLDVKNVALADVSDDGRWVAATVSGLRDRIGIDNTRFGDPTYIAPSLSDVLVIDTQTAKTTNLFPEKRQVRAMKWSPDGSRLALLVLSEDSFKPMIWERASNKWLTVTLPPAKVVAENSELSWTPDSAQLLLTVRGEDWAKQARAKFEANTKAAVVVLSSKEPFLAWGELRRMAAGRARGAFGGTSGPPGEGIAPPKITCLAFAGDR